MGKNNAGALLTGLLVGGLAGAAAGILFAPKEGAKTRRELLARAEDIKKDGEKAFEKLRREKIDPALKQLGKQGEVVKQDVQEKIEDLRETVASKGETVKGDVEEKLGDFRDAITTKVRGFQREVKKKSEEIN